MHTPVIVFAFDETHDGVGHPRLQRHRIRATKRQHGVRLAHAEITARAGDLIAKGERAEPEPLKGVRSGGALIRDIGRVREVERVVAVERIVVRMKSQPHRRELHPMAIVRSIRVRVASRLKSSRQRWEVV